jgi:hypothetical protein
MNPRHKERHYGRNGRDFLSIVLKTGDEIEKGKPFFEALGDAFKQVRTTRELEEMEHPVGPGMPIGFRPHGAHGAKASFPIPSGVTTAMKGGVPYCLPHDIPIALCTTCLARGEDQ